MLPALIGVSMGRNPSGAVSDIVDNLSPLKRAKPVLVAGIALEALLLRAGRATARISNWWFIVLTLLLVLLLPLASRVLMPQAHVGAEALEAKRARCRSELVGIDRPFTDRDRVEIEQGLALDGAPIAVSASALGRRTPARRPLLEAWTIDVTMRFGGDAALDAVSDRRRNPATSPG